jgi:hypothetical protein
MQFYFFAGYKILKNWRLPGQKLKGTGSPKCYYLSTKPHSLPHNSFITLFKKAHHTSLIWGSWNKKMLTAYFSKIHFNNIFLANLLPRHTGGLRGALRHTGNLGSSPQHVQASAGEMDLGLPLMWGLWDMLVCNPLRWLPTSWRCLCRGSARHCPAERYALAEVSWVFHSSLFLHSCLKWKIVQYITCEEILSCKIYELNCTTCYAPTIPLLVQ